MSIQINVPVSIGEIIDKLTILYIKKEYIINVDKLKDIEYEIQCLEPSVKMYIDKYKRLYNCLIWINKQIWNANEYRTTLSDIEEIKTKIVNIMLDNDARFRLKNKLNYIINSSVKEHKSYAKKICTVKINYIDGEIISLILYLSIHHDILYINCPQELKNKINDIRLDDNTIINSNEILSAYEVEEIYKIYNIPEEYKELY